jgi:outer membrane biosynthesis protein TonB
MPEVYRAPRRLYVTRDWSTLVEEGDPRAAFLLAGKGGEVAAADVERYGLRHLAGSAAEAEPPAAEPAPPPAVSVVEPEPEPEPNVEPASESKMLSGPPENKAVKAPVPRPRPKPRPARTRPRKAAP